MLGNSEEFGSKFSHRPMRDLASFARTMNMETQAIAKASADLQDTGAKPIVINGVSLTSVQDAALDISADLQFTIWLTGQAYTNQHFRYVADDNGNIKQYHCIASHTSAAGTKPGQPDSINATWRTYWEESSCDVVQASGDSVPDTYRRYYLVLKDVAGVNTTVLAGAIHATAAVLEIPNFEPEHFVAVATIHLLSSTAPNVWGTTDDNGDVTIVQIIGPAFPQAGAIDKN
jgi:hypothetical protein